MQFSELSSQNLDSSGFDDLAFSFEDLDSSPHRKSSLAEHLTYVARKLDLVQDIQSTEGGLTGAIAVATENLKHKYGVEPGKQRWKIILLQNEFVSHLSETLFDKKIKGALKNKGARDKVSSGMAEIIQFGHRALSSEEILNIIDIEKMNFALCPIQSVAEKYLRLYGISVAQVAMLYSITTFTQYNSASRIGLNEMNIFLNKPEGKMALMETLRSYC